LAAISVSVSKSSFAKAKSVRLSLASSVASTAQQLLALQIPGFSTPPGERKILCGSAVLVNSY
jgi:hypothetical protein